MTTEAAGTAAAVPSCARCGRRSEHLFPRQPAGQVCASCYEVIARQRPEWSRLEIAGVVGLLLGSALIVVGVLALIVLLLGD